MVSRGFTLIELLVALTIIALLLSLVAPRYVNSLARADEAALKEDLFLLRDAIDKHFADTGRYPGALEELAAKKYLRSIPSDPLTQSVSTWVVVAPADRALGAVYNVKSGAQGVGRDGKPYGDW
ncbi:MAG: ral secretion pathway protein [Betaproteobacteria bacterium]|jgi:general secretion pathway protein G|nr:ral secretion pathway protein [Betaproteobacteria bacterium]